MKRINAYTRPGPAGSVIVDTEEMLVDLIMVLKADGSYLEDFLIHVSKVWKDVKVEVRNVKKRN